ncbi:Leucine rich repeat-containing protein [Natronincola peptidivorans]|uniref:Leucine rich repeat-containing protein n=1 Tax=Natronincola peptidivorans TaxID=426128 RepID=A0A1I0DNT0_9FIRM|nr:S-layer homology domain-containing protein [Natronincola peptidivorans]SET34187.1 Leucine rich repeat-containing protein [Natronincola peptidivorans]
MRGKIQWKKKTALLISLLMLITMMPLAVFGETNDLEGHWAGAVINKWIEEGLASGYPDGSFRPNNPITRAEFIALTNKAFEFTEETTISFNDVKEGDWFAASIKRAIAAGYISGYPDGRMGPGNQISRQETAVVLTKLMDLIRDPNAAEDFTDTSSIPSWSRGYVGAAVEAGYMRGYPDGSFKAANPITRAEALVVLNKAMMDRKKISEEKEEFTGIIDKAGIYGPETDTEAFDGDVYIKADGVTLQNIVIKGDLIIAEEVGDGEVYLNNVTVEGDTYIRGGGMDSIYINDGRYNRIIIQKARSGIRILAVGTGITSLMIYPETAGNEVILQGDYEEVTIMSDSISLTTQEDTTIKKLIVYKEIKDTKVTTSKETVIDLLDVNTTTNVTNEGRIIRALGAGAEDSEYKVNLPENLQPRSSGGSGGSSGSSTASVSGITATPSAGKAAMGTSVTLSTATTGATIYYTLDGSTPTTSSNQYTNPITINAATTIKAIGAKSGMNNSSVATFSYTVDETTKPKMTVSPSQVTIDNNFDETFTLTIANDTVVNTVYANDVSLGGVFQGMNIGTVARTNSTTVTAEVYGNLANPGVGTITLDADALVISTQQLTADVAVVDPGSPVNKTALVGAIADAETNKGTVTVSTDGSDVPTTDQWVTQEVMTAYETAIATAEGVANDASATQQEVDDALTALATATTAFNNAKQQGLYAETTPEQYFTFISSTGRITGYDNAGGLDVMIPSTINGYDVTIIGGDAFSYKSLTSVVLPDTIEAIWMSAFRENQLTSIKLPNSLESISASALRDNNIYGITIGSGVTIGNSLLDGTNNFRDVYETEGAGKYITSGSLKKWYKATPDVYFTFDSSTGTITDYDKNGGSEVVIPHAINGVYVKNIGAEAFKDKDLTKIIIPNSVENIENNAFADNNITDIIVGSDINIQDNMLGSDNNFRDCYNSHGAAKYYAATQDGLWKRAAYEIGETGPAGGIIFYDKGNDADGWRYLEAAPASTQWQVEWGAYGNTIGGTDSAIGTGAMNTSIVTSWLNIDGETNKAAQLSYYLEWGGYKDWFLPSIDELIAIYDELYQDYGFNTGNNYWSSSEGSGFWADNMAGMLGMTNTANSINYDKNKDINARAIRAFSIEPGVTIPVQDISLSGEGGQDTISVGDTLQMLEVFFPANATNQMVTWESSNETVATVDTNGLITAVAAGTTDIKVTSIADTTKIDEVTVTVND